MRALLLLIVALLQTPATWRPIVLIGPEQRPVDASSCRWANETSPAFRRGPAGGVEAQCAASPKAVLICDPAGFEPRDMSLADACASTPLIFDPARPRRFASEVPSSLAVSWLRWETGPAPETRAIRSLGRDEKFEVAAADRTFLRFAPAGLSPFTLRAADLVTPASATLRSPGPGGELFIRAETAVVMPIGALVSGPSTRDITFGDGRFASLTALPDGEYTVQPLYDGGIKGTAVTAKIVGGRSTDVWIAAGDVGGIRLVADRGMCDPGDSLEMSGLPMAFSPRSQSQQPVSLECHPRLGGLAPGYYFIALPGRPLVRPTMAVQAAVVAGEWTEVRLARPPVLVWGRITSRGLPLAGYTVTLLRLDRDGQPPVPPPPGVPQAPLPELQLAWAAIESGQPRAFALVRPERPVTDPSGQFEAGVAVPGRYLVLVDGPINASLKPILELRAGDNVHDVEVGGTLLRLTFTLKGRPIVAPLIVRLTLSGPSGTSTHQIAATRTAVELTTLGYGTYSIAASSAGSPLPDDGSGLYRAPEQLVSRDFKTVTLSETAPVQTLAIDLVHRPAQLELQDDEGWPIEAANLPDEVSPGRYSLAMTPTGTHLIVRPMDRAMSCHLVTSAPLQRLVIPSRAPVAIELRFENAAAGPNTIAVIHGTPGATCPVPLSRFMVDRDRSRPETAVIMLTPGDYRFERDGKSWRFSVPGPPVIIR